MDRKGQCRNVMEGNDIRVSDFVRKVAMDRKGQCRNVMERNDKSEPL